MENYNFEVDEDTIIVFTIISRFLKKYFIYQSDDDVIAAINNFYSKRDLIFQMKMKGILSTYISIMTILLL